MNARSKNQSRVIFWITSDTLKKFDDVATKRELSRAALLRTLMIEAIGKHEVQA